MEGYYTVEGYYTSDKRTNLVAKRSPGFVLLDALMAIFLFGLGFAVLYGLTESALAEAGQAEDLTKAANIAQQQLEGLQGCSWTENFAQGRCIPGEVVRGEEGRFHWSVFSEWDGLPDILHIKVEVLWPERRKKSSYQLESVYHVE